MNFVLGCGIVADASHEGRYDLVKRTDCNIHDG